MMPTREVVQTLRIPLAHPALPGHFPGNPVVPGVVLLDRIAAALERCGDGRVARIGAVKFLAPLRPEEIAQITLVCDDRRVRFRIDRGSSPILSGEGELA